MFLRNVSTSDYGRALGDVASPDSAAAFRIVGEDKPGSRGPTIDEYCSHEATMLSDSKPGSLRLTIKEPPFTHLDPPGNWANVDDFGADPTGQSDSSGRDPESYRLRRVDRFFPRLVRADKDRCRAR